MLGHGRLRQRQLVKIGGVALVGALAVGAALIAEHLAQRADALRSGAAALAAMPDAPGIDAPCLAPALVSDALQRSAALDDGLHGAWLPASMWANALDQVLVQRVADSVLAKAVLPALACRLNERVAQLTRSSSQERSAGYTAKRDALLARADQIATLDAQLTDFALLTSAEGNAARKLDALSRLLVEQLGLTALPAQPSSLLGRALVLSAYPAAMNRISATRETQAQRITDALAPLDEMVACSSGHPDCTLQGADVGRGTLGSFDG